MINPFNYLFYKIYTFFCRLSPSMNPTQHLAAMGLILLSNIYTISLLIRGNLTKEYMIGSGIVLSVFILPYAISKRKEKIISKYEKESEKSRLIGNAVVTLYVVISIVSFVIVIKKHL